MIRAAVIPYLRRPVDPATGIGTCCLVVIHDGGRALAEEAIPVGYLDTSGAKPVRVVGEREVALVVARVVVLVREYGAEAARIESPFGGGAEAERGRDIAYALVMELPRGMDVDTPSPVKGDLAERLRALMDGGSDGLQENVVSERERSDPQTREHVEAGPVRAAEVHGTERVPVPALPAVAPDVAVAPKCARRIAGIDPGSKHVAVVVLEGEVTPLRHIASLPLTIGRAVPLRTPKTITRKDGSTYTKTERHEVTDADVDALLRDVAAFLALHEVDLAVVETAAFAFKGAGALLLRSNRYGGVIEGALRAVGLPVRSTTSRAWRTSARKMAGGEGGADGAARLDAGGTEGARDRGAYNGSDGNPRGVGTVGIRGSEGGTSEAARGEDEARRVAADWRPAVRALVANLPPDASPHILDASGCALFAVAPPPEVKPAPTRTRAPRGSGKAGAWTEADADRTRARRMAKRIASGCLGAACVERWKRDRQPHEDACPLAVAANEKRSARMMGNENARRSE